MLGYEYEFTKLLVKEFWYVPDAPQPFSDAVDWQPVLAELDQRVKAKAARRAEAKRAQAERLHQEAKAKLGSEKEAFPSKSQEYDDDLSGKFGL